MTNGKLSRLGLVFSICFSLTATSALAEAIADAGDDVDVPCAAGEAEVTLDGTGSSIGPDFTYEWVADDISFNDETSLTPTAFFPVGDTEVTLRVTEDDGLNPTETAEDTVIVTVSDNTPPVLQVSADPSSLWPPNHKLHDISVDVDASDECDAEEDIDVILYSIMSSEPDNGRGDGNTDNDIQGADEGTDDRDFQVRAERSGRGSGRIYTATYRATDLSGNSTPGVAIIKVAHDQRNKRARTSPTPKENSRKSREERRANRLGQ
jgi:hypothetical protein